jgi:hypothetical protein
MVLVFVDQVDITNQTNASKLNPKLKIIVSQIYRATANGIQVS